MIKAIGICMTLAACGGMGFLWARVYEGRLRQLISLEGALQLLETEIIYGATPMVEAMSLVAGRCDREISGLFDITVRELDKMEGLTAGEAWNRALDIFSPHISLKKSDVEILRRMGAALGGSDREDQAKHLKLTQSQLKLAVSQAEELSAKYAGMYKYLGFLGGLFLVLVIY